MIITHLVIPAKQYSTKTHYNETIHRDNEGWEMAALPDAGIY